MSKGSGRRPSNVSRKKFDEQWDRIFQKEKSSETKVEQHRTPAANPVAKNAGINRAATHRDRKNDYDRKDKWPE